LSYRPPSAESRSSCDEAKPYDNKCGGLNSMEAAGYSAVETLRDERSVTIRALKPGDRSAALSAAVLVSAQSLYRRFFGPRREFTESETEFFVNVDFVGHVASVVVIDENGKNAIVGAGHRHATVRAELAFGTID
jgi:hypothetical protein